MSKLHFTTKHASEATVQRNWYIVDGTNQTVGRICSKIAAVLRGKNKAYYTPHVDCGDFVIVINAEKSFLQEPSLMTSNTSIFSGYPGGKKEETAKDLIRRRPEVVVERAVKKVCFPKIAWVAKCIKNYLFMLATNIRIPHSNLKNSNIKKLLKAKAEA